ncbi:MAG: hypothetical protein QOK10_1322 [Pseudonocardiales bacterium]|nr:hypothetical protein [Pseudonocardiales bacterium]
MTRPLSSADRQRLRTPAYLWRSLIPLLVIVGLLVFLVWPRGQHSDGVHVVDTAGPIAAARQQAGFTILTPSGLPTGWRATSTEFTPAAASSKASFRIGYVSPKGQYAEFIESNDPADALAAQYGPLATDTAVMVNGSSWEGFRRDNNRQLIRRTMNGVTVVVTGSAEQGELVQLAGSLH